MNRSDIPQKFRITEHGVRSAAHHCPHSIPFPAMMSALKTFMGLPARLSVMQAHGVEWQADNDYFYYMGVSGDGFTLRYNMLDFLREGKWNNQSLKDCFLLEGIAFRLFGDDTIPIKDEGIDWDTIGEKIVQHLLSDRPVILLQEGGSCKLVVGYTDYSSTLIVHNGGKGVRIAKTAKPLENWTKKLAAVIFVDGLTTPGDKKEIAVRALSRAFELLSEKKDAPHGYGYGEYLWKRWISLLEDDRKYRAKSSEFRYINPEKYDLAERRAYTADFFEQSQEILGVDLSVPARAFRTIHDKMWDVHWQVYGPNKKRLQDRATREKIIWFLIECRDLEKESAEALGRILPNLII